MHRGERPLRAAICRCGQKFLINEDQDGSTLVCHHCGEAVLPTETSRAPNNQSVNREATAHSSFDHRIVTPSREKPAPPKRSAAGLVVLCLVWCKLHLVEVIGSLVVHGAAALVMLSILLEHQRVPELKPLSATVELADVEIGDVEPVLLTELSKSGSASSEIAPPDPQLAASILPVTDAISSDIPQLKFQAPAASDFAGKSKSGSTKKGRGRGKGEGEGDGNGGTSFFGKTLTVDSIAYVIDASGSMQGARFRRARQELVKALKEMRPEQRFYIVFYTDQTYPLYWPNSVAELQPATPFNLQKTGFWLEKAQTSGGTEPQEAMRIALALKPDVVFLLSDGDIPPETRAIVMQENKQSVIHTIALGSNKGAVVMKQIAAEHKGEFKFIPD
jgi:DNA-directed RNA polymerase subunit RPC12/RpoP